jgi:hypothetical protein
VATSRRTATTTLAGIGLAALLLTGCASGPAPKLLKPSSSSSSSPSPESESEPDASGQTTAEACAVVKDGVSGTMAELQSGMGELQTDPAAAVAAVNSLATAFETTSADVENQEVLGIVQDATAALKTFGTQVESYAANPEGADTAAVQASSTAVQESLLKLGTTCS